MSLFELLGSTADGVFAVDREQRIAFWNEAAGQILGFEAASVLGRPCYSVLGGRDAGGCPVCERRCETSRASLRGELTPTRDVHAHTRARGRIWINVTTFVLPSRFHELALLAHMFRDASASASNELPLRMEQISVGSETGHDLPPPPAPRDRLTSREQEVLWLLAAGISTQLICTRLGVQTTTARTHVRNILEKLGVHSRLEAVAYASRNGMLRPTAGD